MKANLLVLALAAGTLATGPAFAHGGPGVAGGLPPGVTLAPPAAAGKSAAHMSVEGSAHTNGLNDSDRVFGRDRAEEVEQAGDKAADRKVKAKAK